MRYVAAFVLGLVVGGCWGGSPDLVHSGPATSSRHSPQLEALAEALKKADDAATRADLCRRLYARGPDGHAVLVTLFGDPDFVNKKMTTNRDDYFGLGWLSSVRSERSTTGVITYHHFPMGRPCFTDMRDGTWHRTPDLDARLLERLATDDGYLDRFIRARHKVWLSAEACVDELTHPASTAATRRLAHRYLRDYAGLALPYEPTAPIEAMPKAIQEQLLQWKEEHCEGASSHKGP